MAKRKKAGQAAKKPSYTDLTDMLQPVANTRMLPAGNIDPAIKEEIEKYDEDIRLAKLQSEIYKHRRDISTNGHYPWSPPSVTGTSVGAQVQHMSISVDIYCEHPHLPPPDTRDGFAVGRFGGQAVLVWKNAGYSYYVVVDTSDENITDNMYYEALQTLKPDWAAVMWYRATQEKDNGDDHEPHTAREGDENA
jgi:hypothetical protein